MVEANGGVKGLIYEFMLISHSVVCVCVDEKSINANYRATGQKVREREREREKNYLHLKGRDFFCDQHLREK